LFEEGFSCKFGQSILKLFRGEVTVEILPDKRIKPPRHLFRIMGGILGEVRHFVTDPYRPELHYMRGPGPKWHEKHDQVAAPNSDRLSHNGLN
jgi:hypothetical protein